MIKAIKNRVLVRQVEKENKVGSILLASEKKEFHVGELISIGNEVKSEIKAGEFVFYHRNSGLVLEHEGVQYLSLREEELLASSDRL